MSKLLLIILAIVFSIGAMQAKRLIISALWLAGVSALISVIFYLFGARQVAVIELSVGAGLVTVLFVFAISIAGEENVALRAVLPRPLIIGIPLLLLFLLSWYILSTQVNPPSTTSTAGLLEEILWQQRGVDVLVQVVLIFSGVLGLLGLLAEVKPPLGGAAAEEISAERERDLQAMQGRFSGEEDVE